MVILEGYWSRAQSVVRVLVNPVANQTQDSFTVLTKIVTGSTKRPIRQLNA